MSAKCCLLTFVRRSYTEYTGMRKYTNLVTAKAHQFVSMKNKCSLRKKTVENVRPDLDGCLRNVSAIDSNEFDSYYTWHRFSPCKKNSAQRKC